MSRPGTDYMYTSQQTVGKQLKTDGQTLLSHGLTTTTCVCVQRKKDCGIQRIVIQESYTSFDSHIHRVDLSRDRGTVTTSHVYEQHTLTGKWTILGSFR